LKTRGGRAGRWRTDAAEDLTADLLRFGAALVTLVAAIALGLVR
jgi:hypothetical protein